MTVMRVERVVYGVPDLDECARFFTDLGLDPLAHTIWTLRLERDAKEGDH